MHIHSTRLDGHGLTVLPGPRETRPRNPWKDQTNGGASHGIGGSISVVRDSVPGRYCKKNYHSTMAEMVGRFADSHGRGGVEDETTAAVSCVGGHRYEPQRARIPDDNINIWPTGQYDLNPSPVVDDQQLVSDYMEWWRSGELQYGYQMVVGRQEKLVRTSGEAVPHSEWALHVNRTHTATAMTRSRTLSSDLDPRSQ